MNRHPTEAMIQAAITAGSAASENGWMDCVTHAEMEAALTAALAVEAGATANPMSFFSENVDRWGAAEWFNRLANAIREQDKACVAKDDIAFETYRMIAASSAMTLVRDHEAAVRSALTPASSAVEAGGVTPAQYETAAERLTVAAEGVLDGLCIEMDAARRIVDFVLTETFGRARTHKAEATIASLTEQLAEARDNGVSVGIALSVAYLIRDVDQPTYAEEWWNAAGLTVEQCERLGLDEYDLEPIRATLSRLEKQEGRPGLEGIISTLTAERDALIRERDIIADANHRQAFCIHQCAAHIGPDTAGTLDGLPKAVAMVVRERDEAREALKPFARLLDAAELMGGPSRLTKDSDTLYEIQSSKVGPRPITLGDLRRARSALTNANAAEREGNT